MPVKTLPSIFIPDWPMLRQEIYCFFMKKFEKSGAYQFILPAFIRKP
jgi:hypothetical protein